MRSDRSDFGCPSPAWPDRLGGMPALIVVDSRKRQQSLALSGGELTFGRAKTNDIVWDGHGVSRFHGRFFRKGDSWTVEDLSSSNGIVANGQFVARHELADGDVLLIGEYTATYREAVISNPGTTSITLSDSKQATTVIIDRSPGVVASMDSRRLCILYEISKRLLDQNDTTGLVEVAASFLASELKTEVIVFGLTPDPEPDPKHVVVWPSHIVNPCLSRSVLLKCLREGRAVLASDTAAHESLAQAQSIIAGGLKSIICVPLVRDSQVCGYIYAYNRHGAISYQAHDLDFASAVGTMVGTAVEHTRLREAERRKEQMEAELASAREVQQSILPRDWVQVPDWDVYGDQVPSREVGGDYYDAVLTPDGRLWLIVADVCGKGVPAALLASAVHAAVHTLVGVCPSPAVLLNRMNDLLLVRRSLDSRYVTCLAVMLNCADGTLLLSSAGHPAPLAIKAGSFPERLAMESGLPLGLFEEAAYADTSWAFHADFDTLMMYTDGISEVFNDCGEQFGDRCMLKVLSATDLSTAESIVAAIHCGIESFSSSQIMADDMTVLVCRRTTPPAE